MPCCSASSRLGLASNLASYNLRRAERRFRQSIDTITPELDGLMKTYRWVRSETGRSGSCTGAAGSFGEPQGASVSCWELVLGGGGRLRSVVWPAVAGEAVMGQGWQVYASSRY